MSFDITNVFFLLFGIQLLLYAQSNIIAAFFTALTKTSTSSMVLYKANEALTVPGMPKRVITGSAQ